MIQIRHRLKMYYGIKLPMMCNSVAKATVLTWCHILWVAVVETLYVADVVGARMSEFDPGDSWQEVKP